MYEIVTTVVFALVVLLSQWIIARYEANRMRDNVIPEVAAAIGVMWDNVDSKAKAMQTATSEELDGLYEQIDDLHEYLGLEYVDEGEKLVKTKKK